jgi:hypothetical protein
VKTISGRHNRNKTTEKCRNNGNEKSQEMEEWITTIVKTSQKLHLDSESVMIFLLAYTGKFPAPCYL